MRSGCSCLAFFLIACAFVSGCSSVVQSDRVQCSSNTDCTARGSAFTNAICVDNLCQSPGAWSCLGQVVWPAPTAGQVTATLNLTDIITSQPMAGVSARVCHKLDPTCAAPVLTGLVSDAAGRVAMTVPQGFDGYVELTATGAMRGAYFFYPPLTADREIPSVPILQASALTTFAGLAGVAIRTDRAHVMVRTYNCLGHPAEGVRFSSAEGDSSTTPFYMIKGIPSTKQSETDSSGQGGLLNVPPGSVTLTGQLAKGESVGTLSVFARAGELTYTALVPAPR